MKYSIIYSSKTGNTALLAKKLADVLPADSCIYSGPPDNQALEADIIFIGFWTDKGSCDELLSVFLQTIQNKKVFLFGTAGFGNDPDYFTQILSRVKTRIDCSNTITGTFMCQGKMPLTVRQRYEAMRSNEPAKAQNLLENFDQALTHPDKTDLLQLEQIVHQLIKESF